MSGKGMRRSRLKKAQRTIQIQSNSKDLMTEFKRDIDLIVKKYGNWGTKEETTDIILRKLKTLFYKTFGPKVRDKFRPKIEYDYTTKHVKFALEDKGKKNA